MILGVLVSDLNSLFLFPGLELDSAEVKVEVYPGCI